jgi:hypothetical protein
MADADSLGLIAVNEHDELKTCCQSAGLMLMIL